MKILIINLKNSTDRRDFQLQQADQLNLSIEFIEAVSIEKISDETYSSLYDTWERPMLKKEVCCFLSHRLAWKKVIEHNQPILILEDDAILSCRIKYLLSNLENLEGIDRINLESRIKKKVVSKKSKSIGEHRIMELFVDRSGAAGYILYPAGARKLIHKYSVKSALADKIDRTNSLKSFQIEPSAILPIDFCDRFDIKIGNLKAQESTINKRGTDLNEFNSSSSTIYKLRRFLGETRLIRLKICNFVHSQKRMIKVEREDFLHIINKENKRF